MLDSLHVRHHMNPNFISVTPDQEIREVIHLLNRKKIFGAPVIDNLGNLVGMLSGSDCIVAALESGFDPSWRATVKDLMSTNIRTVEAEYSILFVAKMFTEDPYRRYPVVEDNRIIGHISRTDILQALGDNI